MAQIKVKCKVTAGFMPATGLAIVEGTILDIPEEAFSDELFEIVPADPPEEIKKKK